MTPEYQLSRSCSATARPRANATGSGARTGRLAATVVLATVIAMFAGRDADAGPRAWQDPATGLAIGGYDPVAYFTQNRPRAGRDDVEFRWGGGVWRFVNPGNRAAFRKHPDVYVPRFAGYDVYSLANGYTTRGHPSIWTRYKNRIYLFHSSVNRRLWQQDRDRITARAEKSWPALSGSLPSTLAD